MADELIDIVDEAENIVAKVLKSEAHKFGVLHKTVIAQVEDFDGNVYLVEQASDRQDAGQFVFPVGGHVKSGEGEEEALKRETKEELGITEFRYELLGKKVYSREVLGRKENHYFVVFKILTENRFKLGPEAASIEKFTKDQLLNEINQNPKKFGDAFYFVYENFYA